jgi:hypothetical protein
MTLVSCFTEERKSKKRIVELEEVTLEIRVSPMFF